MSENECACNPRCDLFSFMATEMGVSVLHPGGYSSTKTIGNYLRLRKDSTVLDVACGVGTTSAFLGKRYKAHITGIDLDRGFIEIAKNANKNPKINYMVADALRLPFPDNSFDSVIAQAFLILIDDHERALKEIFRVLKPGGYFGSLELSWNKTPDAGTYNDLLSKTCTSFIPRTRKFEEWIALFKSANFICDNVIGKPMTSGFLQMVGSEGLLNSINIMGRMLINGENRTRMMEVQKTFKKYGDYLGYGIYLLRKE